jgi:hypothetical protein
MPRGLLKACVSPACPNDRKPPRRDLVACAVVVKFLGGKRAGFDAFQRIRDLSTLA